MSDFDIHLTFVPTVETDNGRVKLFPNPVGYLPLLASIFTDQVLSLFGPYNHCCYFHAVQYSVTEKHTTVVVRDGQFWVGLSDMQGWRISESLAVITTD